MIDRLCTHVWMDGWMLCLHQKTIYTVYWFLVAAKLISYRFALVVGGGIGGGGRGGGEDHQLASLQHYPPTAQLTCNPLLSKRFIFFSFPSLFIFSYLFLSCIMSLYVFNLLFHSSFLSFVFSILLL